MIDLDEKSLAEVRAVLAAHAPDCEALAFGSRVSGGAGPYSDLDLALRCGAPLELGRLAAIRDAFAESSLPIMVDVLDWRALSENFRTLIEKNCEVLRSPRK